MIIKIECRQCGKVASWNNLKIGVNIEKVALATGWAKIDGVFKCPECSGLKFPL